MSIESNQQQQPDGRGAAMIDREPLQRDPNPGRKPEQTVRGDLGAHSGPRILAFHAEVMHRRPSGAGIWGIPVYTGVTRGKRLVVLVGQRKAVAIAVKSISGRRRWSKLREWLSASSNVSNNTALRWGL